MSVLQDTFQFGVICETCLQENVFSKSGRSFLLCIIYVCIENMLDIFVETIICKYQN